MPSIHNIDNIITRRLICLLYPLFLLIWTPIAVILVIMIALVKFPKQLYLDLKREFLYLGRDVKYSWHGCKSAWLKK